MKELILLLLCSCLSGVAMATPESTHVLIKYNMGNQITRSGLTVLTNGLVMRDETLMGRITYLDDQQLTEKELKELKMQIDEAVSAPLARFDNIPAAHGSSFGEVQIFAKGSMAYLYVLAGDVNPDTKTMVCQSGSASDAVRAFIQARVRDQMPLDRVPCVPQ